MGAMDPVLMSIGKLCKKNGTSFISPIGLAMVHPGPLLLCLHLGLTMAVQSSGTLPAKEVHVLDIFLFSFWKKGK